ncbi:hypothetical protein MXL46_11790 [Heyndrickxia sporothermodurans]|uniref:Uncharacterized protein n=1 Tax=Heyndrickxia sporothermodurans TaxID=46224 RepID=A0A150KKM8_9BACI|nr:hypothetical protein [Heyndrickxia sporothermodurans]KYC90364.1 hypothetical protein B4102_3872 [Heyndrickxia sporothermodurans]MBL5768829.1 hypothetical protein [Heyndrickxia sporothermodurans]MBL5772585.1 hypothetical protein [Heyndrickxia sporothermodurans]MBL5776405.1 hypothetical protein [Heyndrickxia sporothermodurans]MBL5779621.1 hypothetical protein [Heyndrickxia sporothermodurans]
MAIRREDIHKLIEEVPDEKLSDLVKVIKLLTISEEEPTKDENKLIKEALKEYENGETSSYTIDELRKEYLEDE